MISEQLRAFLAALPPDNMPPGVHNELLLLLGVEGPHLSDDAPAKESHDGITEGSAPSTSSSNPLEDIRQSFMKMAPRALEVGEMTKRRVLNRLKPLSRDQQIELWVKIWNSFDFNNSQRIDVTQEWDEQPVDLQILYLALSEWPQFDRTDNHSIRDLIDQTARELSKTNVSDHSIDIIRGCYRLSTFLKFKRALQPQCPGNMSDSCASSVPFGWLDVQLSHFHHLGWRFLEEPDYDDNMIDYNDYVDDQDPRAEFISRPEDHFRQWQEGGLLMTDVRVPLPEPLLRSTWSLGKALEVVYSVRHHPLCMLEEAWRFAKEFSEAPSDADLRAALLYQVIFCLQRHGPFAFWNLLGIPNEQQLP